MQFNRPHWVAELSGIYSRGLYLFFWRLPLGADVGTAICVFMLRCFGSRCWYTQRWALAVLDVVHIVVRVAKAIADGVWAWYVIFVVACFDVANLLSWSSKLCLCVLCDLYMQRPVLSVGLQTACKHLMNNVLLVTDYEKPYISTCKFLCLRAWNNHNLSKCGIWVCIFAYAACILACM